jgi:hypothetical protein
MAGTEPHISNMTAKNTDTTQKTPTRRTLEKLALAGLLALTCTGFEAPASAANFISNGTFTSTSGTFGTAGGGINTDSGWTAGGSLTNWAVVDVNSRRGWPFCITQETRGTRRPMGKASA